MSRLWRDARLALRGFRRDPAFTVSAVLILGVGIGMAVAMWTVFDAVLLRRIPVQDPERVVLPRVLDRASTDIAPGQIEVRRVRQQSRTMQVIAAYAHGTSVVLPMMDGDRPLPLAGSQVEGQFFDVLGVRPVLGRLLHAGDDSLSLVMVLSYDAWQRYFGGDPNIVGRRFWQPIVEAAYTVVGVAPPGIDFPAGTDYWETLPYYQNVNVIARLAPGATPAMAREEFLSLLQQGNPDWKTMAGRPEVRTFDTVVVGNVRPVLVLLLAAVGLLLLIVCINVGGLLLLRAARRSRELAVRRALGATNRDVARQLVVESSVLAAAGGVLGLASAEVIRRVLIATAPAQLPRLDAIRVSGTPVGAAAGVAFLCVLLFGVLPSLVSVHRGPAPLRLDTRSGTSTRRSRAIRQALVGFQVALALLLLAGAALLSRSLERLQSLDLGYRTDHLSVVSVSFPFSKYSSPYPDAILNLWDRLEPGIRAIPGVVGLSPTVAGPLIGVNFFLDTWHADGQSPADAASNGLVPGEYVGPDYFRTLGIPILRGRAFLDTDREHSEPVIIVSAAVAQRYWPGQDPIGKHLRASYDYVKGSRTVVGVVGETHWRALREMSPMAYLPYRQAMWQGAFVLRTKGSLDAVLPAIRREVSGFDPAVTVWQARTMDDYLAKPLAQPRMSALLLSTFGLVALGLAAIGLFGLMASAVREETRDIGVRMALGATPRRVRAEVLRRAMVVSASGAAVGIVAALAASRVIASLLFQVSPTDPVALAGACAALLAVALIAAYLPARHASRVDPARALQAE
jgi:predicted permease